MDISQEQKLTGPLRKKAPATEAPSKHRCLMFLKFVFNRIFALVELRGQCCTIAERKPLLLLA